MNNIKISVVVPIYNAQDYLEQCLDSVVNQTLKDIEIILVNDGSKDNSEDICKKYLSDSRVIYYKKENEGLAAARADGIERASGEYIGFVDSDDWLESDMYEKMYSAAKSNDSDVVFCNCIENEDGHKFTPEMRTGAYNRQQILDEVLPRTLAYVGKYGEKRAIRWCNWLRIYKSEFLKENNIKFDRRLRRSQDLQLTYESMLYAKNFYYMGDDYLYHNRVVADSLSRGYTKNMWPLYTYLIDILYNDTLNFTERDLMPQMLLRLFFFATDCIENEFKFNCPNNKTVRIEKIKEIMDDERLDRFFGKIPTEKLNTRLKNYYSFILKKDAQGLYDFELRYEEKEKKQQNRAKLKAKIMDILTENKLYKLLRNR